MENSTEKASTDMPMGRRGKADGRREREFAGWMELKELPVRLSEKGQIGSFSRKYENNLRIF
jgi:hypothetical protein